MPGQFNYVVSINLIAFNPFDFFNLLNQVCQGISWNSDENATMIAKVVPPEGALHDLKNKLLKKKAIVIGS